MKKARLAIKIKDGQGEVSVWWRYSPTEKPETPEKPDRGKAKVVLLIVGALAIAILGLVILLVVRSAPEWGELLRRLAALVILSLRWWDR